MEQPRKEMLKAYVDSQKFNSTTEIMDAMKEIFRDVLQRDISEQIKSLYDVDISPELVSKNLYS